MVKKIRIKKIVSCCIAFGAISLFAQVAPEEYVIGRKDAEALVSQGDKTGAITAYYSLFTNKAVSNNQKADALRQAALLSIELDDYVSAHSYADQSPILEAKKYVYIAVYNDQQDWTGLINYCGSEDFSLWPDHLAKDVYLMRARAFMETSQPQAAVNDYLGALAFPMNDNDLGLMYCYLGDAYLAGGDPTSALAAYRDTYTTAYNTKRARAYNSVIGILLAQNQINDALAEFASSGIDYNLLNDYYKIICYMAEGSVYKAAQDYASAEEKYISAIYTPDILASHLQTCETALAEIGDARGISYLASLASTSNWQRLMDVYKDVDFTNWSDADAGEGFYHRGKAYYILDQYANAIADLSLVENYPVGDNDLGLAYCYLGDAYLASGDPTSALAAYRDTYTTAYNTKRARAYNSVINILLDQNQINDALAEFAYSGIDYNLLTDYYKIICYMAEGSVYKAAQDYANAEEKYISAIYTPNILASHLQTCETALAEIGNARGVSYLSSLASTSNWQRLVDVYKGVDFTNWSDADAGEGFYCRGKAYYVLDQYANAIADLSLVENYPVGDNDLGLAYCYLGDAYLASGDPTSALAAYRDTYTTAYNTKRARAYNSVINILLDQNQVNDAVAEFASSGIDYNLLTDYYKIVCYMAEGKANKAAVNYPVAAAKYNSALAVPGISSAQQQECQDALTEMGY